MRDHCVISWLATIPNYHALMWTVLYHHMIWTQFTDPASFSCTCGSVTGSARLPWSFAWTESASLNHSRFWPALMLISIKWDLFNSIWLLCAFFCTKQNCCMLAGFAFHDSGHNNAECGVDRCNVNFLSGSELGQWTRAVLFKFFLDFTVKW